LMHLIRKNLQYVHWRHPFFPNDIT
jgi:hypothetical protein